jgi:hypothetical protein
VNTITVRREWFTDKSTIGELFMPDSQNRFCYTLEDTSRRGSNGKELCIPAATYPIIIDKSVRFGVMMPHILNVPGSDGILGDDRGIRIHWGNTDVDTKGCIILGYTKGTDYLYQSRAACDEFITKLHGLLYKGPCQIEIVGGWKVSGLLMPTHPDYEVLSDVA